MERIRSERSRQHSTRCKLYVLVISVLTIVLLALFFTSSLSSPAIELPTTATTSQDKNLELKLVHVLFRHGARTPADTYPNDIFINNTFQPYGWGQLTNAGKQQMFELGDFLRLRYDQYLSRQLKLEELHAQSTGVARTKMSLQLVLAGLFPPKRTLLEWNPNLNWMPIPFDYEPLDADTLLLVRMPCPRYDEELQRVLSEDVKREIENNAGMLERLSNITGLEIKTPDEVQSLYNTLKAELEFGLKLPPWTKEFFPNKLQQITDQSFVFNSYNGELKRLKGGVLVKKAIDDWKRKIDDNLKQKLFLYAGHDSTITNILSAFNVWEQQFPGFGVTAILELLQHKETKVYGVQIFLRNSTTVEPQQLTIPGCEKFCPLDELEKILSENIPKDWAAECAAKNETFIPPPPKGP